MFYLLYDLFTYLAAPIGLAWLALHPKNRTLLARWAPKAPACEKPPLWVHACSVGEVGTAKPIIRAFHQRHPEIPIVLTASTITGHDLACQGADSYTPAWLPFDLRGNVREFIQQLQPRALVLIETEIWPNLIREAAAVHIPVLLFNARLSDKHFPRYYRLRNLLKPVFKSISGIAVQNNEYAARFMQLGVSDTCLCLAGNTKFDGVTTEIPQEKRDEITRLLRLSPNKQLLVFGSTRPGDEALAAQCWRVLAPEYPDLKLVIAPRHRDRLAEAIAPFEVPPVRWSALRGGQPTSPDPRVIVVDTLGDLVTFYAMATIAVVGGSFYPGVNGHNPLEPAVLGIPTVFGPFMRNFIDPAHVLVSENGACQVPNPEALLPALQALLNDESQRAQLALRGRNAVLNNRGAIDRSLDYLDTFLYRPDSNHEAG